MKILLLGANGQLGRELQRSLAPLGCVVAPPRSEVDLVNTVALTAAVRALRPAVIVNAAAYTAVDRAESEPEAAHAVNALAPGFLAREAQALGAWLVHYSTDYVFDGRGSRAWTESDLTGPLNVYGQTKLDGERAIQTACAHHLIFRTAWLHGDGGNFVRAILHAARQHPRIVVANDQFGAPTEAALLADVTALALRQVTGQPSLAGLYHLTASGDTSRLDYALFLLEHARKECNATDLVANEVVPVATDALSSVAVRPLNSRLDCAKAVAAFGLNLPSWQTGVAATVERLLRAAPATR
ncbi:dTDP-4-dehydrorhamnose reductase [Polaromonas sp.]|uniref:dTDP-4-dehydrorhamnose reductase n=1 Tax=Polaromonas sp. TaxID=1869339 RepID=UPI003262DA58